jgi:hypothetical protein
MGTLPIKWRNFSNFNKSNGDDAFLKTLGWIPLVEVPATCGADETYNGWTQSIGEDVVTSTEQKRNLTSQELADRAILIVIEEIVRLEELETPRRIAEAVLTDAGKSWLQSNRDLIVVERNKL